MPDHAQLLAEIEDRERELGLTAAGPNHDCDCNACTDERRRYTHYRRILERHPPVDERPYRNTKCRHTAGSGVSYMVEWPCPEVRDLADALGLGDGPWQPTQPAGSQS